LVINFTKKIRKITFLVLALMLLIGGGIYLRESKDNIQTSNVINEKSINQYTMDVIFDDESKRLMCNQNIEYINNTNTDLDKLYFNIYPNAFSKEEYAPFEKDEMKKAYPNGFNEGYIDIKNVLSQGKQLSF